VIPRRARRALLTAVFLAGPFLADVPCRAAGGGDVSVAWSGPPSCADAEPIERRVAALAGPGAHLEASGVVTAGDGEWIVSLRVRAGDSWGERVLRAPTCEALRESVAVVLALSATPETARLPSPRPPPPEPPPPAEPGSPPGARDEPLHGARENARVRLAAEAALDAGTLPRAAFGADVRASVAAGSKVTLGLAGGIWLEERGSLPGQPSQGARFDLLTADAFGCYEALRGGRVTLAPCATVEWGHVSASGFGALANGGATADWLGVGLGARAGWAITTWLAIGMEAAAVAPTGRQKFSITGAGTVFTTAIAAGRVEIGPELRF